MTHRCVGTVFRDRPYPHPLAIRLSNGAAKMAKHKRNWTNRSGIFSFVTGWAATYLVALVTMMIIHPGDSQFYTLYSDLWPLLFAGIVASLQFLWLRRSLGITLWSWLPLALLGVIVGEIVFEFFAANVEYPFPPKLYSSGRMPEPEQVMQLKFTLYTTFRFFLLWSTPLIFQWLALRKRFVGHGLWLVAAVVSAPLNFVMGEYGGIFVWALRLLGNAIGISLIRDAQPLGSIAALLDTAAPTMMMGLTIYWLLTQSEKMQTDHIRAPQQYAGK